MAELVDAPDSKSSDSNIVRVRFPLRPPRQLLIGCVRESGFARFPLRPPDGLKRLIGVFFCCNDREARCIKKPL